MDAHIQLSSYSSSDGQVSVTHASLHISRSEEETVQKGNCFDPQTACDQHEQLLIEKLRSYLRPQCAPACLIERLRNMFDNIESLEGAEASQEITDGVIA